MFQRFVLFHFVLLFSVLGRGETRPKCSAAELSRNCQFFEEQSDQKEIKIGNTSFGNPRFPPPKLSEEAKSLPLPKNNLMPTEEDLKEIERKADRSLELQTDVMAALGEEYNLQFRVTIASFPVMYALASKEGESSPFQKIRIPWPPKDPKAKLRTMTYTEFKKAIAESIPENIRKRLEKDAQEFVKNSALGYQPTVNNPREVNSKAFPQPKREDPNDLSREQLTRLDGLVVKARSLLLDEIAKGRSFEALNADEQAMYRRVERVEYVPPTDPATRGHSLCHGITPNAFYRPPPNHTFTICPNMANYPNSAIIKSIAHEMGHTIDPCILPLVGDSKSTLPGVPPFRYPQKEILECIQRVNGMRPVTLEDTYARWKDEDRLLRAKKGTVGPKEQMEIKQARKDEIVNPLCLSFETRKVQSGEIMADAWAAKVVGRYLEEFPPKNDAERIAPYALYFQNFCSRKPTVLDVDTEEHPYENERIDGIAMMDVRIQNAMKCEGNPENNCLQKMGTLPAKRKSRSNGGVISDEGRK